MYLNRICSTVAIATDGASHHKRIIFSFSSIIFLILNLSEVEHNVRPRFGIDPHVPFSGDQKIAYKNPCF